MAGSAGCCVFIIHNMSIYFYQIRTRTRTIPHPYQRGDDSYPECTCSNNNNNTCRLSCKPRIVYTCTQYVHCMADTNPFNQPGNYTRSTSSYQSFRREAFSIRTQPFFFTFLRSGNGSLSLRLRFFFFFCVPPRLCPYTRVYFLSRYFTFSYFSLGLDSNGWNETRMKYFPSEVTRGSSVEPVSSPMRLYTT